MGTQGPWSMAWGATQEEEGEEGGGVGGGGGMGEWDKGWVITH
jgi:hypothetical protein